MKLGKRIPSTTALSNPGSLSSKIKLIMYDLKQRTLGCETAQAHEVKPMWVAKKNQDQDSWWHKASCKTLRGWGLHSSESVREQWKPSCSQAPDSWKSSRLSHVCTQNVPSQAAHDGGHILNQQAFSSPGMKIAELDILCSFQFYNFGLQKCGAKSRPKHLCDMVVFKECQVLASFLSLNWWHVLWWRKKGKSVFTKHLPHIRNFPCIFSFNPMWKMWLYPF